MDIISDLAIELKVCQPICNTAAATRNCIPKCCPPDKILGYWSFRCIQLFQEEPRWKPLLCNGEHCAQQNPSESIHFHEHSIKYTCQSIYLRHPSKTMELIVPGVVYDLEKKQNIRLDTSQGRIQLQQLTIERKWEDYNVDFCADGFVRSGSEPYTGAIENQVVITCKDDEPEMEEFSHDVENWASIITQLLGCVLMLTTVTIYLVLLKQQNFNGLMILSYATSSFFSYVFSAAAHFIAVSDDPRALGFAERGALCMVIAIAIQFFHYGTYAWLTVMNYNLWQTLKSLNPANTGASKRDPLTYVIVPDYAVESCSTATYSRGYFIYIPTAIILVVNGLLTLLTLKVIIEAKINAAKMAKTGADRYTARLFFKLFFLMGAVCFLTMLLWYYNSYTRPWYVSVVKLIIQLDSIPLFILFSCNDRTLAQLQDRFPCLEGFFNFFKDIKLPSFTTQTSVVD
ncbi:G-protein coupled receptor Mth2 [Orchesella cincta]|uniref:G-protein coupled receptor Mth2 n=1 Tax=Orchesella cincta TaxID=48709 RepID=A0A1D2M7A4_ORCCI|nr:G-protein coupled receptor Mth2 [Orchesella cincta]